MIAKLLLMSLTLKGIIIFISSFLLGYLLYRIYQSGLTYLKNNEDDKYNSPNTIMDKYSKPVYLIVFVVISFISLYTFLEYEMNLPFSKRLDKNIDIYKSHQIPQCESPFI